MNGPRIRRVRVLAAIFLPLLAPVALAAYQAFRFFVSDGPTGSLVSGGERREYVLHVPDRYDPRRPAALVISLHGAGLWGRTQLDISHWNDVADRHGFIVVYPSGLKHDGPRIWRVFPGVVRRDVRFIADLIDTLRARYAIDPSRIYADGLSNGGGMAFALSCELPDRIAAIGMVAAAQTLPWDACSERTPVPAMAIHGTADRATPYRGGTSWVMHDRPFPAIPAFMARFAARNGCAAQPVETRIAHDITRLEYVRCAENATVVLYTVHEGGHTWPGGGELPYWLAGRMSGSMSASEALWEFYQAHPLRKGPRAPD